MKSVRALDVSADGKISADEFKRLYNPTARDIGACSAKLHLFYDSATSPSISTPPSL